MIRDMKRFASLILAIVMVFSMLPAGLLQAQAKELSQTAYADADLIFDQLDAAEEGPDKRNATTTQKVEAAMEIVRASDSYVEGSLVRNGNSFTWWTDGGVRCVYSPRMREIEEDRTPEASRDEIVNEPVAVKGGSPTGNQVYLIGPYYGSDSSFTDQYKKEAKRVAEGIGDVDGYTLYSGVSATVDKVAEAVSNGAVVFFDSHGMTDYENPSDEYDFSTGATYSYLCLTSTTGLTSEDYNDGALYYSDGICINGATIANHMTKNSPSGLLWMAICLGMATDTICQPLREKGVEVVYGYSESVTFEGDYRFEKAFWDAFLNGDTVADSIASMKEKWGNYDWSTQIADDYGSYDGYTTVSAAQRDFCAFPVVVSDEDAFPGKRTTYSYGASALQTVKSTYTLFTLCDHIWTEATCTVAATCTLCGRVNGKPASHPDNNGDVFCDVCGKDLSVTPNTYVKVTESLDDWSGQYLIVWEAGKLAFNGSLSSYDAVNNGFAVTIEDDTIVLDDADAEKYFVIEPYESWYTVRSANGYYIGNQSGGNKVQFSKNPDYVHDLYMEADGSVLIEADDYSILRFNNTSGQMRFRFYKTASYASQQPVALYKLVEETPTEPTPTVPTPTEPPIFSTPTDPVCNHSDTYIYDAIAATCTGDGYTGMTLCLDCGEVLDTGKTIPALGHNYVGGSCVNCGAADPNAPTVPSVSAEATISFANVSNRIEFTSAKQVWQENGITVTNNKASSSSNVANYYDPARFYAKSSLTIEYPNMVKLTVTCANSTYANALVNSSKNLGATVSASGSVVTITFSAKTDSFTIPSLTAQVRVQSMEVEAQVHQCTSAKMMTENVVAATCTEPGSYDAVFYCAECSKEISRTTVITAALGHQDENQDGKCDLCGTNTGPALDENAKFASTGLSLGTFIGMQSLIKKSSMNGGNFDEAYYIYVHHGFDEDGNPVTTEVRSEYSTDGKYYFAECPVNAKQMSDIFEITPYYVVDGVTYRGVTTTTSVKAEAMETYNTTDDVQVEALCAAMLNYGAQAQKNFGYNLDNLANADLAADVQMLPAFGELGLVKTNDIPTDSIKPASNGLSLGDVVYMQFMFKMSDINSASSLVYQIGNEEAVAVAIADLEIYNGKYYVISIALKAKYVRSDVKIALPTADGGTYTMTCSVEAFAAGLEGETTENLVNALMLYGDAAKAKFGS